MTGMSKIPLAVGRVRKSRLTSSSSTGGPGVSGRRPSARLRWIRKGACVAKNTAADGLTASVLRVAAATAGSQHR